QRAERLLQRYAVLGIVAEQAREGFASPQVGHRGPTVTRRQPRRGLGHLGTMHIRSLSVLFTFVCAASVARAAPPGHVEGYVLLRDDNHTTMSGDMRDLERVKKLRQSPNERLVWFRADGREDVIRDAATIAQVDAIWKPVETLGAEMGKLGGKQGELGAKQGEVGAEMGKIGARMGELGAELGELETRQPTTKAERKAIRKRKRAVEREMHDL